MTVSPIRSPSLDLAARAGRLMATTAVLCALAMLAAPALRAQDANTVVAKVNGSEIRQSDVTIAEEELGPSLQQMDPATRRDNVISFLVDMKIVAKAACSALRPRTLVKDDSEYECEEQRGHQAAAFAGTLCAQA